jgi:hypothetical protein
VRGVVRLELLAHKVGSLLDERRVHCGAHRAECDR